MEYCIKVYSLSWEGNKRDLILECKGVNQYICVEVIKRYASANYAMEIVGYKTIKEVET